MTAVRGVVTHNVVALRADPKSGSEQVSQALMGETLCWEEDREGFVWATTPDAYQGWVWRAHLRPYDTTEADWGQEGHFVQIADALAPLRCSPAFNAGFETQLTFGTRVRTIDQKVAEGWQAVAVPSTHEEGYTLGYLPLGALKVAPTEPRFNGENAAQMAQKFMGTPYLWGGGTPFGFDCSGFVQRLYAVQGVLLPRDAHQQATSPHVRPLHAGEPFLAGDLLFFCGDHDPRQRGITHIGMALDATRFIHASGKEGVAITPCADPYYSRTFRFACRHTG